MMPMTPTSGELPGGRSPAGNGEAAPTAPVDAVTALADRAEALWRRLVDIERALSVQEWWMLGRAVPEAGVLAEVASLLAVARGELEHALSVFFGRSSEQLERTDVFASIAAEPAGDMSDPAWLAASRDQAVGLLRMIASMLPPMLQYAQMLADYGQRLGLTSAVIDAFGIVSGRLVEVNEALRQPPR